MSVDDTFTAFQQLVDADAECNASNMEIMERININATNKYMNLSDQASRLEVDREYLKHCNSEIQKYCEQVDRIVEHIDNLEAVTKELDKWSRELEVKSRRLSRAT